MEKTMECTLCDKSFETHDRGNLTLTVCPRHTQSEGPAYSEAWEFLSEAPEDWELDAGMIGEVL